MTEVEFAPGLTARESTIEGHGCFATRTFKKGRRIAEYTGERVSRHQIARRVRNKKRIYVCGVNSYWGIDGSVGGNGTQYINHSCQPNAYMRVVREHILFFALRDISAGEEITLDYIDSYHSDEKRCQCGSPKCRSRINRQAN
jgi:SET domain-containing protein